MYRGRSRSVNASNYSEKWRAGPLPTPYAGARFHHSWDALAGLIPITVQVATVRSELTCLGTVSLDSQSLLYLGGKPACVRRISPLWLPNISL